MSVWASNGAPTIRFSEAANMEFVASHTRIPVPRVHDVFVIDRSNVHCDGLHQCRQVDACLGQAHSNTTRGDFYAAENLSPSVDLWNHLTLVVSRLRTATASSTVDFVWMVAPLIPLLLLASSTLALAIKASAPLRCTYSIGNGPKAVPNGLLHSLRYFSKEPFRQRL